MFRQKDIRRRLLWRRIRRVLLVTAAILVVLIILAPTLLPSSFLADRVRQSLEESLGRPVEVGHCSVGWITGVRIDELAVGAGKDQPGGDLIRLRGLKLAYQPWELLRVVTSPAPYLGRATVEHVEAWVVRDIGGRIDLVSSSSPAPDFKSISVEDGTVHLVDVRAGTRRQVTMLRVVLGRLEGSEKVYVTGGGRLLFPDEEGDTGTAIVSLNGLLDHFDLNNFPEITGGCDIDWEGVDLAYFLPAMGRASGGHRAVRAVTSGQASLRIDASDQITFEGGVSAPELTYGPEDEPQAQINRSTLSFTGTFNKSTGHARIQPVQISGAGSSVRMAGQVDVADDGSLCGELTLSGMLSWTPLKREIAALGSFLAGFTSATGTAGIDGIKVTLDGRAAEFGGRIDLRRSELVREPYFVKPADCGTDLLLDGRVDLATGDLELREVSLLVNCAQFHGPEVPVDLSITARTVPAAQESDESAARDKAVRIDIEVPDMTHLPQYIPLAGRLIHRLGAGGRLALTATVEPWLPERPVTVSIDAGDVEFRTAPEVGKSAGEALTATFGGTLGGAGGRPELTSVQIVFGRSSFRWDGVAYAAEEPGGRRLVHKGRLEARGVQEWVRLVRPLLPARPFVGVVGNMMCEDIQGHLGPDGFHLEADAIDAERASIEVRSSSRPDVASRLLSKPLGEATRARIAVDYRADSDQLNVATGVVVESTTVDISAQVRGVRQALGSPAVSRPEDASLAAKLTTDDLAALLVDLPALGSVLQSYGVEGGFDGELRCTVADRIRLAVEADLTRAQYAVPDVLGGVTKTPGLSQRFKVELDIPGELGEGLADLRIANLSASAGPTTFVCEGAATVDAEALRHSDTARSAARSLRSLDLSAGLSLVQDAQLKALSSWWRRFSERTEFEGRASAKVQVSGNRDTGRLAVSIDATDAGFQYGEGTRKPAGLGATAELAVGTAEVAGQLDLERAHLHIADTEADVRGTLFCLRRIPRWLDEPIDFILHVEGRSGQLARLAQLVPVRGLRRLEPQGGVEFSCDLARDRYGTELRGGEFTFDQARVKYGGAECSVDGRLVLSRQRLLADALSVGVGDSSVTMAADIASPFDAPTGQFAVTGPRVDLEHMLSILGVQPSAEPVSVGIPPEWRMWQRFLLEADLKGTLAFGRFVWSDKAGVPYDWSAFATEMQMQAGRFEVPAFKAVMLGGVVAGRVVADMTEPNPLVKTQYAARNLKSGDELAPMIRRLFPDMTVSGAVDQTYEAEQRLFATPGSPNYPVGVSRFAANEGMMQGPAAPKWMTDLLPGLKLTTYRFSRMESLTKMLRDGRAESLMLFDGSPYSVYIKGYTEADGTAEYALGVDLFTSVRRGEEFRALQQGWIPLLVYSGRIAESKWVEQEVRYKLPHEVAYELFLQRNILTRLLRASGEKRRPDFEPYDFKE